MASNHPEEEGLSNGRAAAAILAAGIGSGMLGLAAILADGSDRFAQAMTWYVPSGPLSGVTSLAVIVWLVVWFVLHKRWKQRDVNFVVVSALAFASLALGLLLTFPPLSDRILGK